ncbi:hypothetical protein GCK32_008039 [Trichostrongylus colubriformis]|uniref:Uncharacterized protein n=1 Tax=Trichostrongylus colubriformis TaxID=6319 RepID=A0AAN8IFB6_TRICO
MGTTNNSNEEILHDVATTFWLVFIFYVFASVAWITYCVVSYRRDLEQLKITAEKNGIARYLELRRLLKAYDSKSLDTEGPKRVLWITETYAGVQKRTTRSCYQRDGVFLEFSEQISYRCLDLQRLQ